MQSTSVGLNARERMRPYVDALLWQLIFRFPASHAGYALKTLYNPSLRLG
jgi:hypothetical protein